MGEDMWRAYPIVLKGLPKQEDQVHHLQSDTPSTVTGLRGAITLAHAWMCGGVHVW